MNKTELNRFWKLYRPEKGTLAANVHELSGRITEFSPLNTSVPATLCDGITAAIELLARLFDGAKGAIGLCYGPEGRTHVNRLVELRHLPYPIILGISRNVDMSKPTKFYAVSVKNGSLEPYKLSEDNGLSVFVMLLLQIKYIESTEVNKLLNTAIEEVKDNLKDDKLIAFANHSAVISETIYRMLLSDKLNVDLQIAHDGCFDSLSKKLLATSFLVKSVKAGTFSELNDEKSFSSDTKEFVLNKDREFTDIEKSLIPSIEPWYVVPEFVPHAAKLACATTGKVSPIRNFLFRGPSSTGKTAGAKALASLLMLPYVTLTCSADTDSYAFWGQPMYDQNGSIHYVDSPFIQAIKNGWVIEIQEPYCIAKQGVLTSINSLLEVGGKCMLPSGEIITRHPDAVVVFTTNVGYAGCKPLNQSVLRRFGCVMDIQMPAKNEVCARIMAVTGYKNKQVLGKMYDVSQKINRRLKEESYDDGVCGVSEIMDWVQALQVFGDEYIVETAENSIVAKATDDEVMQASIKELIAAEFPQV